ncbi:lysophospholipase [Desulfosporosinus orientis DSM 765]|uniref:Monoacylglycerol lipase n=2 Tax=Desulfosporosinus orientis TaxID=1563 RepID=G7WB88_DESOD|nr:lysophospholipase [Desulfosporosinus orientis DSM 765]
MTCREFAFAADGGELLYGREWRPASKPLGVVLLVHGLGEHCGRYEFVAEKLSQAGYGLLAFDLRGHGKSLGRRGHISAYEILLADLDGFIKEAGKRFPNLPAFLYGHSMGGNLVLNYVLRRQPPLAGGIATSPWLWLAKEPPGFVKILLRFLAKLWPTLSIPNGLDVKALCHDQKVVKAYQEDPLVHNRISLSLLMEIDKAANWAMANAEGFGMPLLLMHGGSDGITSPEATQQFAFQVAKDCTFKLWPGLFHELHNEPEKEEVLTYLINWLQNRETN